MVQAQAQARATAESEDSEGADSIDRAGPEEEASLTFQAGEAAQEELDH